jgi:hypothetical protein
MLQQLLLDLKDSEAPISPGNGQRDWHPEYIEGGFHVVQFEVSGQKLEVIQRIVDWDRGGRSRKKVNVYCAAEAGDKNGDSLWFDGRSQDPLVMHRSIMCIKEEDGKKQYLHKWQPGKMSWDLFFGGPKEYDLPPTVKVYQVGGGTTENGGPAGPVEEALSSTLSVSAVPYKVAKPGGLVCDWSEKDAGTNKVDKVFLDSQGRSYQAPQLSFPRNVEWLQKTEDERGIDWLKTAAKDKDQRYIFAFTPSYQRYSAACRKSALLDRSNVMEESDLGDTGEKGEGGEGEIKKIIVPILVVRRDGIKEHEWEFSGYCENMGKDYIIVSMPDMIDVQPFMAKNDDLNQRISVLGKSQFGVGEGIGFARLFIQLFAWTVGIKRCWMIDDNVEWCMTLDINKIIEIGPNNSVVQALRSCSFADVMVRIETEIFGKDTDKTVVVRCGEGQREMLELAREVARGDAPKFEKCPDPRKAPRGLDTEVQANADPIKERRDLCGDMANYAIIGMYRNDREAWEKRLEGGGEGLKPFVVGQQVYSFFLFNVAGTVERGLLYPVKPVMEDIHFNQLCEESKMAVLRCNRFFHSKKNLSQLNTSSVPKSLEPPESLEIRIQDLGDLLVLSDDFCTENTNGFDPLEGKPLPAFFCSITREIMRDPVATADGQTFERAAIERWLERNDTSPATGLKLPSKTLVPNIALRQAVEEWEQAEVREYEKVKNVLKEWKAKESSNEHSIASSYPTGNDVSKDGKHKERAKEMDKRWEEVIFDENDMLWSKTSGVIVWSKSSAKSNWIKKNSNLLIFCRKDFAQENDEGLKSNIKKLLSDIVEVFVEAGKIEEMLDTGLFVKVVIPVWVFTACFTPNEAAPVMKTLKDLWRETDKSGIDLVANLKASSRFNRRMPIRYDEWEPSVFILEISKNDAMQAEEQNPTPVPLLPPNKKRQTTPDGDRCASMCIPCLCVYEYVCITTRVCVRVCVFVCLYVLARAFM